MELHALDRVLPVAHAHDFAVLRAGGDLEAVRHAVVLDHQRVIARGNEAFRKIAEHPFAAVLDLRRLAMHHLPRAHDFPAERLADRLVPEANAEQGYLAGKLADQRERDTRLVWCAWPRRQDHPLRFHGHGLGDGNFIVAKHAHVLAKLAQVLHEVVGKRIVVVDHQQHGRLLRPRPAGRSRQARFRRRAGPRASCAVSPGIRPPGPSRRLFPPPPAHATSRP